MDDAQLPLPSSLQFLPPLFSVKISLLEMHNCTLLWQNCPASRLLNPTRPTVRRHPRLGHFLPFFSHLGSSSGNSFFNKHQYVPVQTTAQGEGKPDLVEIQ